MTLDEQCQLNEQWMRAEIMKLHRQVWKLEVLTSGWKANLHHEIANRLNRLEAASAAHEEEFNHKKI